MMKTIGSFCFILLLTMCTVSPPVYDFDLQGHRGARGLAPENTIPSFLIAIDHGVDTIELDLVVTSDRKLLVSHEPWFDYKISTKPDGNPVAEDEQMEFNIFEMSYEETQAFDVGKRGHLLFPEQEPMTTTKPLLKDAVREIDAYVNEKGLEPVWYNVETKSRPEWYGVMSPQPEDFAAILYEELKEIGILDRVIVQSFDPATLIAFRKLDDGVQQAMLVSEETPMQTYLDVLGYTPEIWSPYYQLVTPEIIRDAEMNGMKVIPWTINERDDMIRLLEMGVDGIITDYPDRAKGLK
jgi:glycerophosphoryl diester phosphodiesterase